MWQGEDYKAARGNLGEWWICVVIVLQGTHLSKLPKLHALNMCSLSYVDYPSMKLYFNGNSDTYVSLSGT